MRAMRRRKFLIVLLLVALLGPASSSAQIKSNFASSIDSESMTAMWVARERGLFKKHGLEMQYVVISRSPLAVAALIAGEIDAAIIGPCHPISAGSNRADLVGIATLV